MNLLDITPAIFCKNEEYWIHFVLRDLLKVFPRVVMLDTGSRDATKDIAQHTAQVVGQGELVLVEADYGSDPHLIGNSPNVLRELTETWWMLLLAGDEVLREPQLRWLENATLNPHDHKVGMMRGINVADASGALKRRNDDFTADKFFDPTIVWTATEYPFEGYGQHNLAAQGLLHYLDGNHFYYWHVRHCLRSSLDGDTYFRGAKMGYYPYSGAYEDLPFDWLGEQLFETPNPYVKVNTQ